MSEYYQVNLPDGRVVIGDQSDIEYLALLSIWESDTDSAPIINRIEMDDSAFNDLPEFEE